MNTEELKQKALAATPGPWIAEVSWQSAFLEGKHDGKWVIRKSNTSFGFAPLAYVKGDKRITDGDGAFNAQFIAAANPAVILALIAERDELLAALKESQCVIFLVSCQRDVVEKCMCAGCIEDRVQEVIAKVDG